MHSIKICRSKIAASTVWLTLPKFHYACKWDSAFSCELWDVAIKWACQSLVKNKMSLDLPRATLLCILTLEYPIWNTHNVNFSQVGIEFHKGHWYTYPFLKTTESLLRALIPLLQAVPWENGPWQCADPMGSHLPDVKYLTFITLQEEPSTCFSPFSQLWTDVDFSLVVHGPSP